MPLCNIGFRNFPETLSDMNQKTAIRLPSKVVRYSKTDSRYWGQPGRLFTQHGNTDYCCRFSHNGKRGFFDLNTADKAIAQKRAVDRYKYVVLHGWEAALKNPDFRTQAPQTSPTELTVGSWIATVRSISHVRPLSLRSYEQALRRLAAEAILKIDHSPKEHAKWQTAVEAVALTRFTGDVLAKWTKRRMDSARHDILQAEKEKHTINHILRSAKSLFSKKKVLKHIAVDALALLPSPFPLSEFQLLQEDGSPRFKPSIQPESLLQMAHEELGAPQKEGESDEAFGFREQQWIAFILSFCAALRRREGDLLQWSQVRLDAPEGPHLVLEKTKVFKAKNKAHEGMIPLDPEVAKILAAYKESTTGETFVLQSDKEVDMTGLKRPRCDRTWKALTKWLKSKGEADAKPVHALRKSIGALMTNKFGIHAAQRLLRHTSPTITSKFYSDRTATTLPGIGALLDSQLPRAS